MNEISDDNGQFKMRLDEGAEEELIPTQAGDLRIEKLNHRMTLISILIPVLIVVILVIAYLDIKKRVIQTEDTGQLTAESLSKDLESRFETLTMAQKLMEENFSRLKDQTDQSIAKVQVNLKKLDDRIKSTSRKMVDRADMKTTTDKLDQNLGNVAQAMEELKLQMDQFAQTTTPQISNLENALDLNTNQTTQLADKLVTLDQNKIDKAAMELAIKLEALKIKQVYKAQFEDLQSRLETVERNVAKRAEPSVTNQIQPKPTSASPAPAPSPGPLKEQTIGR